MKSIIHVNRHFIAFNKKHGTNLPVYTVKQGKKTIYGHGVNIKGPSSLVDPRSNKQLQCGAQAWIETTSNIEIIDAMSYTEAKQLKEKYGMG